MPTILFLTYYYPPLNNAGTQRLEKFVRYLPALGWRPIVLTTAYFRPLYAKVQNFRWARRQRRAEAGVFRAFDLRNLILRPGKREAVLFWESSPERGRRFSFRKWLKTWLLWPDSKVTWLPFAFLKALWLIRKYRIEWIFSSFPPATSHLLGYFLKKCTYVRWVADFRDGWTIDPLDPLLRHSPARLFFEKFLEDRIVRNCDEVLATSPDVEKYLGKTAKVHLLTNGFDQEDFSEARKKISDLRHLGKFFVISHPGAFHLSHPGNTPYYFLKALQAAFAENPAMKRLTRVFFLGNLTAAEQRLPHQLGLGTSVKVLGLRSHLEAIQYRLISNLLLLVDCPTPERSTYIHGKVFEHLASRKPILALLPRESAARDFLEKLGVGKVIAPDDIVRIKKALIDFFEEWQRGAILQYELTDDELAPFERKNLTRRLAEILEKNTRNYVEKMD